MSSATNVGSDDECFEDSGCEVNDSQISHDESALSDIFDQQENCCGIDLSMKTLRRTGLESNLTLKNDIPLTENNSTSKHSESTSSSYITSYVSFLGQRLSTSTTPMRLPLRSPTAASTPASSISVSDLDDSGHVDENECNKSHSLTPSLKNNNYMILSGNRNVQEKPLTLKIKKPSSSSDIEQTRNCRSGTDLCVDKHAKCVGVCNGHAVKSKSDKLLLRLSRDSDSNTYTASMS